MPGKVKVRVLAGRNLPVMDRASDTSDAYVEVKLGNTTYKTEVYRRSLNPQWNSEWFKFEVDDEELQDEPLQIRIMDYDTYSANDAIGKVYIDLNPLLHKETGPILSGWFPIYDTMHGIRGEVNIMVKVDLFSDSNKYRESSCGVLFFYSKGIPHGYRAEAILGFVEELVVNDDPEYQWIDKIRTPRASNEARQTLFSKLSGEVQRKIGLKSLELGGNAVVGYHQCFDLEGESGIVVRGIGTAVTLVRLNGPFFQATSPPKDGSRESPVAEDVPPISPPVRAQQSPVKGGATMVRRSSDPDLSTPPKGTSISGSSGSGSGGKGTIYRPTLNQDCLEMLEYPFITMRTFPWNVIQHIGCVVSSHSVKLLDQINNPDDPETRDAWWMELRKEIRSHTRALGCNVVLGYSESTNICDDICILSAGGTAAILSSAVDQENNMSGGTVMGLGVTPLVAMPEKEPGKEHPLKIDINLANQQRQNSHCHDWNEDMSYPSVCSLCHIPYSEASVPFPVHLAPCAICRRSKVPDTLLMTVEPPPGIPITGKGCLVQARVCRIKRDLKGEQNAKDISDSLTFLEYELHKQLLTKLKMKGMNAIFGLKVQISVGEKMLVGIATGTAAYLTALPAAPTPKLKNSTGRDGPRIGEMQKMVQQMVLRNKEYYELRSPPCSQQDAQPENRTMNGKLEDGEQNEDNLPGIDLSTGNKDTFILEVDDAEDDILSLLSDPLCPDGFDLCNTERLPGTENFVFNMQMFTRVYRTKLLCSSQSSKQFSQHFEFIIKSLFVKMRKLVPCCLAGLHFHVELPEQDEVQVSAYGVAVGLGDPSLLTTVNQSSQPRVKQSSQNPGSDGESELIFSMDEEKSTETTKSSAATSQRQSQSHGKKFMFHSPFREPCGIELTPLGYMPSAKIDCYLGNLDFFFIRESNSLRENGGLNAFIQSFIAEVLAIVRAHVASLGGNAMVSFQMVQCILMYNPHKNQGQCLINVVGDAVRVSYATVQHSSTEVSLSDGERGRTE